MEFCNDPGSRGQYLRAKKPKKIHQCPICTYTSINTSHLRDHILRHTGQKPHQCHVCNKFSRTKSDLKKHLLTHWKQMGGVNIE
ncbi:unnamed protein product [Larinioides sclopetarius]|uniref:C2H2-type domain-containing protein n=1 Tax=Larinioides sclopetarius TaxID=280406 RepID=A0AAV2BVU9_9ARAC